MMRIAQLCDKYLQ